MVIVMFAIVPRIEATKRIDIFLQRNVAKYKLLAADT